MIEKPIPPGDYDCCESGCEPCVWDIYQSELAQWRAATESEKSTDTSSSS